MLNGVIGRGRLLSALLEGPISTVVITDPVSDHLDMGRVLNIIILAIKDEVHVKEGVAAAARILMKKNVPVDLETSGEDPVVDLASCMDHLGLGDMDLLFTM